ncbi:MAG: hypothetical protein ACRDZS_09145 [Acidimicrobiales bacterium]
MADRPVAGTEGPRGHEARPPTDDRAVPRRVFLAVGVFVLVLGAIYWGSAHDEGGTVMLIVAGVLALWMAPTSGCRPGNQPLRHRPSQRQPSLSRASPTDR